MIGIDLVHEHECINMYIMCECSPLSNPFDLD